MQQTEAKPQVSEPSTQYTSEPKLLEEPEPASCSSDYDQSKGCDCQPELDHLKPVQSQKDEEPLPLIPEICSKNVNGDFDQCPDDQIALTEAET